jgi:hypothetical protein
MPAVIDIVCYYYLCYDTFCYIPVEKEGTIIGSKEPFCFGSSLKGAIFLYNTSFCTFGFLLGLWLGTAPDLHQNPKHNHVYTLLYCCTSHHPQTRLAWHGITFAYSLLTFIFFHASLAG